MWHRASVLRRQIKRGDIVVLTTFAVDPKRTMAVPAARQRTLMFVDLCLAADKHLRQKSIRFRPRRDDFVCRRLAQHVLDGGEQMLANNRVVFCLDAERAVLLRDQLDGRPQGAQVVDIGGVGADGARQGPLLAAGMLVRRVEVRLDFRVAGKHQRVESSRDRFGMLGDDRRRRFDDFDRLGGEHVRLDGIASFSTTVRDAGRASRPPEFIEVDSYTSRCRIKRREIHHAAKNC